MTDDVRTDVTAVVTAVVTYPDPDPADCPATTDERDGDDQ